MLVEGNLIKKIGKGLKARTGATVIKGGGLTLMPGLIEAHAHLSLHGDLFQTRNDLNWMYIGAKSGVEAGRMLLRGFTTARDAAGPVIGLRKAIDAGHVPGPRIYAAGPALSQTGGHFDIRGLNEPNYYFLGVPDTKQWMESLFSFAHNPFVALTAAVLVTAIVQSSSFTTAMIITMAASGTLDVRSAVFAVMGANIGTSVTGIIVSLANIRIRRQFRRAFTAALVHDIFNLLTVAVIFPVEWATGILYRVASFLAQGVGLEGAGKPTNPVKVITKPVVGAFEWAGELLFANASWVGLTMAIGGWLRQGPMNCFTALADCRHFCRHTWRYGPSLSITPSHLLNLRWYRKLGRGTLWHGRPPTGRQKVEGSIPSSSTKYSYLRAAW